MVERDLYYALGASLLITINFGILLFLAHKNSLLKFIKAAHWWSLFLLISAGIFTWVSMVWVVSPDKFQVNNNQWISLGISILISVAYWARFVFTVSNVDTEKEN